MAVSKNAKRDSVAGRRAAGRRPLTSVSTRQQHIASIAKKYTDSPLTTLHHHMDMLWMYEAFKRVKNTSATGVDKVTVEEYAQNLEENLAELLEKAKSGKYRAPPVKRAYIPKNEKEKRPIGIPTTENKVLERAVVMLLEPIYEAEFHDVSYGFRPRRSAHQGLERIRKVLTEMGGGWVVDVDVRKYFDTIPHAQIREILRKRVKDRVILRLLGKWLKAGVWEAGVVQRSEQGTPQGGVISPLLSNIYLHEVLDNWFIKEIKPRLKGEAHLVRFADDFVIILKRQDEAQKVMDVLPKRFEKYGLTIHPEKTRLVDVRHPWDIRHKPETFDFLGFTHYWGKTRRGGYAVMRKTAAKKLRRAVKDVFQWCKAKRHKPMRWQHQKLRLKVLGHYAYYGIRGNIRSLGEYRYELLKAWRYWLDRRSRERGRMDWVRYWKLVSTIFPIETPRIMHKAEENRQLCFDFF